MPVLKTAASCWRRAAEAETQAGQISDRHLKAVYLRIADQWSVLARSYEFADSAERFLLDAKWTKDADAQPPSSADAHGEHLLQPSDGLLMLTVEGGTLRLGRRLSDQLARLGDHASNVSWSSCRRLGCLPISCGKA